MQRLAGIARGDPDAINYGMGLAESKKDES
jgi:hypothetical protein